LSLQVIDQHHELGCLIPELEKLFVVIFWVALLFLHFEALKLTAALCDFHDQSCQLYSQIVFVHLEAIKFQESKSVVEHENHLVKDVSIL
jgi:hypothetical protein